MFEIKHHLLARGGSSFQIVYSPVPFASLPSFKSQCITLTELKELIDIMMSILDDTYFVCIFVSNIPSS